MCNGSWCRDPLSTALPNCHRFWNCLRLRSDWFGPKCFYLLYQKSPSTRTCVRLLKMSCWLINCFVLKWDQCHKRKLIITWISCCQTQWVFSGLHELKSIELDFSYVSLVHAYISCSSFDFGTVGWLGVVKAKDVLPGSIYRSKQHDASTLVELFNVQNAPTSCSTTCEAHVLRHGRPDDAHSVVRLCLLRRTNHLCFHIRENQTCHDLTKLVHHWEIRCMSSILSSESSCDQTIIQILVFIIGTHHVIKMTVVSFWRFFKCVSTTLSWQITMMNDQCRQILLFGMLNGPHLTYTTNLILSVNYKKKCW